MGGTNYSPVVNEIVKDFGNPASQSVGGLFGFGGTKTITPVDTPTYVIFITDGENGDASAARNALINASHNGIFFQFVGIGNQSFNFLRELDDLKGRLVDNANFFKVPSLSNTNDDDLYKLLLNEFPSWLKLAKNYSLIK